MSIRIRRGTDAQWEANKSYILPGEPAVTTDTGRFFVGIDGGFAEFAKKEEAGLQKIANVAYGTTYNITIPNSTVGVLFGFNQSAKDIMYLFSCSASGGMSFTNISSITNVNVTSSTNHISVNNNLTGTYELYYIATNTLS